MLSTGAQSERGGAWLPSVTLDNQCPAMHAVRRTSRLPGSTSAHACTSLLSGGGSAPARPPAGCTSGAGAAAGAAALGASAS